MIRTGITIEDLNIETNLADLRRIFQSEEVQKLLFQATQIIANRAVEILKANNHVVTGTLWRSVHVGSSKDDHSGDEALASSSPILIAYNQAVKKIAFDVFETEVGSWVNYARTIENLPDGGYLVKAFEEKFPEVKEFIEKGLKRLLGL